MRLAIIALVALCGATIIPAAAQETQRPPQGARPVIPAEAKAAVKRYIAAWSSGDAAKVRDAVAYPHVIHRPGKTIVRVFKTPADYPVKWWNNYYAKLRASGYDHSKVVSTRVLFATPLEATVLVEWKRLTTDGREMLRGKSIYVLTRGKPDGELRVRLRHSPQGGEPVAPRKDEK